MEQEPPEVPPEDSADEKKDAEIIKFPVDPETEALEESLQRHPARGKESPREVLKKLGINPDVDPGEPENAYEEMGMPDFTENDDEGRSVWEETVGSSRPFNVDDLTDDEVMAMYNQGRGGMEITRRAQRIADAAAHDAGLGIPEGTHDVVMSPEDQLASVRRSAVRNEHEINDLQSQITAARAHFDNVEVAQLTKRLDVCLARRNQRMEQIDRLTRRIEKQSE